MTPTGVRPVLTFDLFSALIDSRRGGAQAFASIGDRHGWAVDGQTAYDAWDAHNKAAQRDCDGWLPFRTLAAQALAAAYTDLDLPGAPERDADMLIASMAHWPLWPDVAGGLPQLVAEGYRIGLLSNVDDDIFAATRAAALIDHRVAMTSQRLRVYKPDPRIYTSAQATLGTMVHVATSARDVRGALEAGCPVVRLRRPGHGLDPAGPDPDYEVDEVSQLPGMVAKVLSG
ncbi:MAG: HAD family hydrolase [Nocardioidaceae bacterium]